MSESILSGKTAIVTGASSGIGRAIAERLGGAGAHIFLAGRSPEPMETSKKKIEAAGGRATLQRLDVRDVKQVRDLVAGAVAETGRLDVMVNNAGLSHPSSIADGEPDDWREMLETNVLALLVGCQAAIRAMRECGSDGHIVNISSIAALRPDSGVYGATKHAVNCISATLRGELEEDSIRVVNVMPGAVATNFARNFDPEFLAGFIQATGYQVEVKKGEKLPDDVLDALQPKLEQLLGAPEDIANAVLYAVSQPINVNVADIVVRPAKQLNL
ncbi:MAG: SDR family oxidoreductase [Deltaproteobacteria bacterium]|nr:SDR family oxidoreductase [Deltaproteobacteria bacterium]